MWFAGTKRSEWPEAYGGLRKKEILEFTLPTAYQKRLNSDGCCLSENSYDRSIGKIAEVEPEILLKFKHAKTTRDNAKAILELQENAGLRTKSRNGKGKGKNRDKNKSTPKANGPKHGNGYYLCGNCGKTHKSVCRKPVPGATSDNNTTSQAPWMTKKATRNYIKAMVASKSKKKIRKEKSKKHYSSSSSSSESSESEEESRRSGMSRTEQMHLLASAGINPNDSDIEFEPYDERRYRKQAKKWTKSKDKRRRR